MAYDFLKKILKKKNGQEEIEKKLIEFESISYHFKNNNLILL